jgi:signal transduction histidine kinase
MKGKTLQVLLVEDNAEDALLLREMFRKERPGSFELTHVLRMSEAMKHLVDGTVDIALLDLGLPDGHGLDTLRRAHAVAPLVPLIVLTGLDDEALAAQAIMEGAQDYLIKGQIQNRALPRALRYAIERHRMQIEADLIRKQQLEFKDEFLSHVSHELRSPLTATYQFATILADGLDGELSLEQRDHVQIIVRNVRQLRVMIDDLLEVTRVQTGKLTIELQAASVSDAIAYAVNTLHGIAAAKGITLSTDTPPRLSSVYADPARVQQILIILLDNAIKFTPANGVVKIQARVLEKNPSFLLVEVSDSGCGISQEATERIFERLYQVVDSTQGSRKGLGLGLYICKELVTRQGGQIWVKSQLLEGSTFSFTLPVLSIDHLIAPLLKNERWPMDSVALVIVEICSRDGWLSKETREEWSRDTRMLVQRCLLPNLDILLPKMGSGGPGELFFVVAFANEKGLGVLTKRIREQFVSLQQTKGADLTLSVSYTLLDSNVNAAIENIVGNMATKIEDRIKTETVARTI